MIWPGLERVRRRLQRVVERRLKGLGLPPMIWHDALLVLAAEPNGEMRSTELERNLSVRQYQVSRLIERLVDGGCVVRRRATISNRSSVIRLTERGHDLQQRMAIACSSAIDSEIMALYTEDEGTALVDLLNRFYGVQADGQGPEAGGMSINFKHSTREPAALT